LAAAAAAGCITHFVTPSAQVEADHGLTLVRKRKLPLTSYTPPS
jgi:hypothetical protein